MLLAAGGGGEALSAQQAQDTQQTDKLVRTLTIEEALDIAEDNNPQLKEIKLNYESSQLLVEAQRAALKSNFSLNLNPVGYENTRRFDTRLSQWYTNETFSTSGTFQVQQPILLTDGVISLTNQFGWQNNESLVEGLRNVNQAFSNRLNLSLTQPLFTYNRRKMQLKRLEMSFENSGITYALQRLTLERNITSQFYSVFMAKSTLEISRGSLENDRQNYEIIKNKVEADLAAREELYQAEVNLAESQSSVESALVSLENAKDALKQTLGLTLSEDIDVNAQIDVNPISINLDAAVESGLASRLELRQREMNIETEELDMTVEKARNEFSGEVRLSVGIQGDNVRFANIYETPTQSPSVSVSFTVPLFDWGEQKKRIKAQQTAQTIARLNQDNQKFDIELNIRQTWRSLENLRANMTIEEKKVRNAQLTYDLNVTRYREGDLTGMQMSQFQNQLSSAKQSHTRSLINYKIELLNLKILSLYDFDNDRPIVPVKTLENIDN
jgi:outer membrane protein TolC